MQIGHTALMIASREGCLRVVRALLKAGADKDAKDSLVGAGGLYAFAHNGIRVQREFR